MIDARDAQLVALVDPETLVGAVECHRVAGPVVGGEGLLGAGVAARDEAFDRRGGAVHRAVAHEPLTDDVVDPLAQPVARGQNPEPLQPRPRHHPIAERKSPAGSMASCGRMRPYHNARFRIRIALWMLTELETVQQESFKKLYMLVS